MRLIDADALGLEPLTPDVDVSVLFREGFNCAAKQIIEAPTVDPVRHGQWNEDEDGDGRHCSECGHDYCYILGDPEIFEFCPFCGARMDEQA